MTDTPEAVLPDGYYKMTDGGDEWSSIVHVQDNLVGDDLVEWMLEEGYTFEPVVVMTPYEFNKQMRDAYNVGKDGPIEVDIGDLLEHDTAGGEVERDS